MNFNKEIDRISTLDMKWKQEGVQAYLPMPMPENMIPMWVADTDFSSPECVKKALSDRVGKEIFGYCKPDQSVFEAVKYWYQVQHQAEVRAEEIVIGPTVVAMINIAIRAFSEKGDKVLVQQPVYDPFMSLVKKTGRTLVNNGLICEEGRYRMDYELLEQQAADPDAKIMILCSPHNPVGRVWEKEELERLMKICYNHNILVIADEIHSDIVCGGYRHITALNFSQEYRDNLILCNSPGKTFNVPGLKTAYSIIPSEEKRKRFKEYQEAFSLDVNATFGLEAIRAAYSSEGQVYTEELNRYLEENTDYVEAFIKTELPWIKMVRPQGTFLLWLDLSAAGLTDEEIMKTMLYKAGIACVPGGWFGSGGTQHVRLNIGCTRKTLRAAMERMRTAFQK